MKGLACLKLLWASARPVAEGWESPPGDPERALRPFALHCHSSQKQPLGRLLLQAAKAHVAQ
eukprot:10593527-Prorocentrum_lima.AAC.1